MTLLQKQLIEKWAGIYLSCLQYEFKLIKRYKEQQDKEND
jgi:hypothetical protein